MRKKFPIDIPIIGEQKIKVSCEKCKGTKFCVAPIIEAEQNSLTGVTDIIETGEIQAKCILCGTDLIVRLNTNG